MTAVRTTVTRTRTEVADYALASAHNGTYWGVGQCLRFSRTCAGAPGGVYDADAAWYNARHKGYGIAPAGTFVYWAIGRHGHVAVSVGGGFCVSTDVLRLGRADRVLVDRVTQSWNARYRGFSYDINGVTPLDDTKDWFTMATQAELREVVDNALQSFVTSDALKNALRLSIEAERAEEASAGVAASAANLNVNESNLSVNLRKQVRKAVDAELTQRHLGTE